MRLGAIAVFVVLLTALPGSAYDFERSFPPTRGELRVPGLRHRVEVLRDRQGIPHLYGQDVHDLIRAQGLIHAQERFWQMDVTRHLATGTMAELVGRDGIGTDRTIRMFGWRDRAGAEFRANGAETTLIFLDYADGVNAYLQNRTKAALGVPYQVLKLVNPDYQPAFWQPENALMIGKLQSLILGGNWNSERERAQLLSTLTPAQVDDLYPAYSSDRPFVVPSSDSGFGHSGVESSSTKISPEPSENVPGVTSLTRSRNQSQNQIPGDNLENSNPEKSIVNSSDPFAILATLQQASTSLGSNNWVISGQRSATGKPILANDPHLNLQIPSVWYEMGLHCLPKTEACPYDVVGFGFPGVPGILIGHNDRIAWGQTNVNPDVMDLYVEKINPANPNQYEVNGQWVDMQIQPQPIRLPGGEQIPFAVRFTRHGPVISDLVGNVGYSPERFQDMFGVALPEQTAIALQWTALKEPSTLPRSVFQIMRAQNWEDFRAAAANFDVPAQNLVYADVDGNIGYQMPGRVPIRAKGDGRYPVPGWTDDYEWQGYIPFAELPSVFNPPEGYVVSANNAVVGDRYPYVISKDWDYGYRAKRIVEMIEEKPQLTLEDMQRMQLDRKNLNAEEIIPILSSLTFQDSPLEQAKTLLQQWDYQETLDSVPAAIFEVFWQHLVNDTFLDDAPQAGFLIGSQGAAAMQRLLSQPDNDWWDDRNTGKREGRDRIFARSLTEAVKELESRFGKDMNRWRWGDLLTVTFRDPVLGQTPLQRLFNRGAFPGSGSNLTVNVAGYGDTYDMVAGASMRMVVDVGDWQNSQSLNSTGQSGHAKHPHYDDQIEPWLNGLYHPMNWSREKVRSDAGDESLVLLPEG